MSTYSRHQIEEWLQLENWIRSKKTSNLHRHAAGSLSAASLSRLYQANPKSCARFLSKYLVDPTDSRNIEQVMDSSLKNIVESWSFFEDAFTPGRLLLDGDLEHQTHRSWFRQLVVDSAEQGLSLVGIRATFGGEWRQGSEFERVLKSSVQGILEGEEETRNTIQAVLLLGLKKNTTREKASQLLEIWNGLRLSCSQTSPKTNRLLYGIDSVGFEGQFSLEEYVPVIGAALSNGGALSFHLGETWESGKLLSKLNQIQQLLDQLNVSYLTNPNALLVDVSMLDRSQYSQAEVQKISQLQKAIILKVVQEQVILEVSPTSNDILTQSARRTEGWKFLPIRVLIDEGVRIAVTDDNSLIFGTSFVDELRRLFFGETALGVLEPDYIRRVVATSQQIYENVLLNRQV